MFLRSFDSMISVAREKLALNMVDPINVLDILYKQIVALIFPFFIKFYFLF